MIFLDEENLALWEKIKGCFGAELSPIETIILGCLLKHKIVPVGSLVNAVWGSDPNGGPTDADGTIRVHLVHLRRKLPKITVFSHWGVGYETMLDWPDGDKQ